MAVTYQMNIINQTAAPIYLSIAPWRDAGFASSCIIMAGAQLGETISIPSMGTKTIQFARSGNCSGEQGWLALCASYFNPNINAITDYQQYWFSADGGFSKHGHNASYPNTLNETGSVGDMVMLEVGFQGAVEPPDYPETQQELKQFIEKYAPLLYFNEDESYLMTSVEWFLERSNLINNTTKSSVQATLNNLPTGKENSGKYHLALQSEAYRTGDLTTARSYVHAKITDGIFLDIQYWFLYAYNGPGTGFARSWFAYIPIHEGISSTAPLGEHEGDWEHITVRINLNTKLMDSVFFAQHGGGQWVPRSNLEFNGDRLVAYSSLNGHASYPYEGSNFSHDTIIPFKHSPSGIELKLVNATNKGAFLDCRTSYELISAGFLAEGERPTEPQWLNFLNRWGRSDVKYITDKVVSGVIKAMLGPVLKYEPIVLLIQKLVPVVSKIFYKNSQDGPTGPKEKSEWSGNE